MVALVLLLAGCAAATPALVNNEDPTPVPAIAADSGEGTPAPLMIIEPTATPTRAAPSPTPTAEPTEEPTPTPGPTPRPAPPPDDGSGVSQVFDRGLSGRPEIALTFDAGADRGYAEQILDTLLEYGVVASFGITGHWASENPDLVERMADEGHMIFNHTWTHRSFTGFSTASWDAGVLTSEERIKELADTEAVIAEVAGGYATAPYFRPPYGDLDHGVLVDVASAGYWITVMWTCDSLGWNGASIEQIIERCGSSAEAGDIILMHVGAAALDGPALPGLIETLREQGFALVSVEELLQP